jgi:sortase A
VPSRKKLRLSLIGGVLVLAGLATPVAATWLQNQSDIQTAQRQSSEVELVQLSEDPTVGLHPETEVGEVNTDQTAKPRAIAKLRIPRFGSDWQRVVYEGTSISKVLTPLGVGHYVGSALPGQVGNFALAAHRAGSGGPFRKIDRFVAGDLVFVETATQRFTYRFLESKVVEPDDTGVIEPLPQGLSEFAASNAYLTLTSCTPVHINTHRIAAWFELVDSTTLN